MMGGFMQKLLAIDDKMDNLITLSALLKNLMPGCTVLTAQSGMEGIEKARAELPDAILLDVKMPGMDGFETCRRLMSDENTKHIPVIMITAIKTDPESRGKGLEIGANAFLAKPIDQHELVSQVNVALRTKRAEDALREQRNSLEEMVRERTAALRESEREYREIFESIIDIFYRTDKEGLLSIISPSVEQILGYVPDQVIGKKLAEFNVNPGEQDRFLSVLRENGETKGYEAPLRAKDGSVVWVSTNARFYRDKQGKILGIQGISRDITERKRAQEEVVRHTTQTQAMLDLHLLSNEPQKRILDFVLEASLRISQSKYSFIGVLNESESVMMIHRWSREAMTECAMDDKPIEFPISKAGLWGDCVRNRKPVMINDYDALLPGKKGLPDGHVPIRRFLAIPVFDGPRIVAIAVVANKEQDYNDSDANYLKSVLNKTWEILRRKQAEEALLESESYIRTVMDSLPIGIAVNSIDPEVKFSYMNDNFPKYYRTTREALADNDNFWNVVYDEPEFREKMKKRVLDDCDSGDSGRMHWEDIPITRKGCETAFVSAMNSPIPGKQLMISTVWDVTERKRSEEARAILQAQLNHAQKIKSIGSLAGGIAHDLNNILFPISGLSELLLDDMSPDTPEHESMEQIHKSAQRGSDLVKQILAFSRKSNPQKLPIRIQPILKETLKLARATIPMNIEITSQINMDCGMVSADPTQIHQIAMNLITNAYHAVEVSGGMIHIAMKETEIQTDELPFHAIPGDLMAGKYVCITVSDTGTGIDQALIDKIFDPYFTTKEQGKGTGLGLSVVHGIVKEHGGDILVHSEVGKGTTFHVYLPLLENSKDNKRAGALIRKYPTGCERILLVDDEGIIVRVEQKMLERLGYQITIRTGSLDALDAFRANPGDYDLVISDMGMPDMTGMQLARELISIRPGIPIIICTGFKDDRDEQRGKALGIKGFLMKPVATGDLTEMVRRVLDEVAEELSAK
jgi:PAS domain S-box-containing protein